MPERVEILDRASGLTLARFGADGPKQGASRLTDIKSRLSTYVQAVPHLRKYALTDLEVKRFDIEDDDMPLADDAPDRPGPRKDLR